MENFAIVFCTHFENIPKVFASIWKPDSRYWLTQSKLVLLWFYTLAQGHRDLAKGWYSHNHDFMCDDMLCYKISSVYVCHDEDATSALKTFFFSIKA